MSDAFKNAWIRYSPNRQLLTILTYLARRGDVTIPLTELEAVSVGEGLTQSFISDSLVLHHSPVDTKFFVIGEAAVAQRSAQPWQTTTNEILNDIPERLRPVMQEDDRVPMGRGSSLDDGEMAAREDQWNRQRETQRIAREMRNRPLSPPQPAMAPEQ